MRPIIVKSHLFPQFIDLNREIGKAAAVTIAVGTGEKVELGGGSQSIAVDASGHSGERQSSGATVTCPRSGHLGGKAAAFTHNRHLVEAPGYSIGLG